MFPIEIVWQIAPTAGLGNTNPNRPVTTMMMEDDVSVTLMELRYEWVMESAIPIVFRASL